jgi:hypothetical protein
MRITVDMENEEPESEPELVTYGHLVQMARERIEGQKAVDAADAARIENVKLKYKTR